MLSLTSTSRSSQTPDSIDVDIFNDLFNQDGRVKLGYLGETDFDLPKNFNGGAFICFEVEPIVKELSLTWKGYPQVETNDRRNRLIGIINDKLYDSSSNRYTALEDAVGYSVTSPNLNIDPKIKMHFVTVTNGEARTTTFDIPIVRILPYSQYYDSLVAYYRANSDLGGDPVNREELGLSLIHI